MYGGKPDPRDTSVARRQPNNTLTSAQIAAAFPPLPFKESFLPDNSINDDAQLTYAECINSKRLKASTTIGTLFHTAQNVFTKAHLQNLLLPSLDDRGKMAHSVEGRTPFLDHHLTEYVNNLPPSMEIRPGESTDEWG